MLQPWFTNAKLGIFIHWGLYAVNGLPESWSFFHEQITYADYMAQRHGFTAARYDPQQWAALFRRAGARYAVLTSKHHDGVALWDTALSDLSVVRQTPAARDLIAPYGAALRAQGIKVGLYFSHLDWSHPDYTPVPVGQRVAKNTHAANYQPWPGGPDDPAWKRFLTFQRGQIQELCERFRPDLLWFDGDWTPGPEYWRMAELRALIHQWQPEVVVNGRLCGHGDYKTPEQGLPITQPEGAWEFCVTLNDSWGYQTHDHNHKSVRQIVRLLAECLGMGGNLLLDVGPTADGAITPAQTERLEGLGMWTHKHAEAIYDTTAGLPHGHAYGPSTLSADHETLYVFCFDRPYDEIAVKGVRNKIKRASVVGSGRELPFRKIGGADWHNIPGVLWVAVPEDSLDPNATVIKIELEGPLDLYHGAG
jgi:alpha-L-fucosidase